MREPGRAAYRAHVRRAQSALAIRRVDVALEATAVAIELLPAHAEAHAMRAIALGESGDAAGLLREAERALELDPDAYAEPTWGGRVALLLATAYEYTLAARVLRRTVATMPATHQRRQLYTLLGDVEMALGEARLEDAARAYRIALKSGPADSRTIVGLALALRRQGEREAADILARRAAAPGSLGALIAALPLPPSERSARLALLAEVAGDVAGARSAYEAAAADSPWSAWANAQAAGLSAGPSARPRARPPARRRPRRGARKSQL